MSSRTVAILLILGVLMPPVVAAAATRVAGPFHAGWVVILWAAFAIIAPAWGLLLARLAWREFGAGWGYAAFLLGAGAMLSTVWTVGMLGGWTK